jgi:hypothetical protein
MATMTINISEETAKRFREAVATEYGTGKGALGKAVGEALNKWAERMNTEKARENALKILNKGFDLKGAASRFNRTRLYDEVTKHRTGY